MGGKDTGASFKAPTDDKRNSPERLPSAAELGINMPTPTIKPFLAAVALTIPFVGLMMKVNVPIIILGGALFFVAMYTWLLAPLEPEHV